MTHWPGRIIALGREQALPGRLEREGEVLPLVHRALEDGDVVATIGAALGVDHAIGDAAALDGEAALDAAGGERLGLGDLAVELLAGDIGVLHHGPLQLCEAFQAMMRLTVMIVRRTAP